jgi:hypothetical protein
LSRIEEETFMRSGLVEIILLSSIEVLGGLKCHITYNAYIHKYISI